jgi:hypothetical protein
MAILENGRIYVPLKKSAERTPATPLPPYHTTLDFAPLTWRSRGLPRVFARVQPEFLLCLALCGMSKN